MHIEMCVCFLSHEDILASPRNSTVLRLMLELGSGCVRVRGYLEW